MECDLRTLSYKEQQLTRWVRKWLKSILRCRKGQYTVGGLCVSVT